MMIQLFSKDASLLADIDYIYDEKTKRFRYKSGNSKGQFLSRSASIAIVTKGLAREKQSLINLSEKIGKGSISLDKFILEAADRLTQIHLFQGILAKGGLDKLTEKDKNLISKNIKQQFNGKDEKTGEKFGLKHLLTDIRKDKPNENELRRRLELYAESGKVSFFALEREKIKDKGLTKARRLLGGKGNNCSSCIAYYQLGWVDIENLILPTQQCECKNRCNCDVEYK